MTKMLPFTRPTIDEETIQSVVEVLRSGWLATGPKVAALEAAGVRVARQLEEIVGLAREILSASTT